MSGGGGNPVATVTRAATGFVQSGPLGAVNSIISGNASDREAQAAQQAAEAQAAAAGAAKAEVTARANLYEREAMDLAKASPQELRAYEQVLANNSKQLASDEKLLASIDPQLLEASSQALAVMRGIQNPSGRAPNNYAPFEAARKAERQRLVSSLVEQYGPGAETSSIGLKALREFDLASATQSAQFGMQNDQQQFQNQMAQAQGYSGLAALFGGLRGQADLTRGNAQNMSLASIFQNRMLNTKLQAGAQGLSAVAGTQAAVINSAGAQYVGDQMRARYDGAMANQFTQGAIQFGTAAMGAGAFSGGGRGAGAGAASAANQMQQPTPTAGSGGATSNPFYVPSPTGSRNPYATPRY